MCCNAVASRREKLAWKFTPSIMNQSNQMTLFSRREAHLGWHHYANYWPTHHLWVKITPRLSKIHLPLLVRIAEFSANDMSPNDMSANDVGY